MKHRRRHLITCGYRPSHQTENLSMEHFAWVFTAKTAGSSDTCRNTEKSRIQCKYACSTFIYALVFVFFKAALLKVEGGGGGEQERMKVKEEVLLWTLSPSATGNLPVREHSSLTFGLFNVLHVRHMMSPPHASRFSVNRHLEEWSTRLFHDSWLYI